MNYFMIGVAGGSGSGKSTVTSHIVNSLGKDKVVIIAQDYYYKDFSTLSLDKREKINFDHPDSFDWELLIFHINNLLHGNAIDMPTYDYVKYTRKSEIIRLNPAPIIVFEGIFSLMESEISKLMGLKIFVDTASDIRFIRRLQRDIIERGRSTDIVIKQYLEFVRPMYKKFIEPTKRYADIIIPHGANKAALEMLVARINSALNDENLLGQELIYENGINI